jgi:hypothetical protein
VVTFLREATGPAKVIVANHADYEFSPRAHPGQSGATHSAYGRGFRMSRGARGSAWFVVVWWQTGSRNGIVGPNSTGPVIARRNRPRFSLSDRGLSPTIQEEAWLVDARRVHSFIERPQFGIAVACPLVGHIHWAVAEREPPARFRLALRPLPTATPQSTAPARRAPPRAGRNQGSSTACARRCECSTTSSDRGLAPSGFVASSCSTGSGPAEMQVLKMISPDWMMWYDLEHRDGCR